MLAVLIRQALLLVLFLHDTAQACQTGCIRPFVVKSAWLIQ